MSKRERYGIVKANVMQDPDLSLTSKAVYGLLCTFANKERECFPTITHLSELLSVSRRTIERAIVELKEKKYVTKEGRNFKLY